MGFSRPIRECIKYPPEALKTFELIMYEWIDNLNFTIDPKAHLENAEEYVKVAKELFLEAGWDGDGEIKLMWIPPFMFHSVSMDDEALGVVVWHVKQFEDGLSWILSPVELPCREIE